jgi:hypothetical protein
MLLDRLGSVVPGRALAAAFVVLTLLPAAARAQSETSAEAPRAVEQRGVVEVNGCLVSADDIALTATPMVVEGVNQVPPADPPDGPSPDRMPVRRARVTATADQNVFEFVFDGLKVTTLYTLDVRLPDGRCPKTTWIGPKRGVIAPGAQTSVNIRGFALTTRIDVESPDGAGGTMFRASDFVTLGSAERRFRLVTDLAGVSGFELQIATERFQPGSETTSSCGSPAGLIHRRLLDATGGVASSPVIDFDRILYPDDDGTSGTSDGPPVPGLSGGSTDVPLDYATRTALENGAPMYVRAIPTRADGTRLCERLRHGASAHSIVAYIGAAATGLSTQPSLLTKGEYRPAQPVSAADFCVTVVKPHVLAFRFEEIIYDAMFLQTGQAQNGVVPPGSFVCWNKSSSVIDDIGDFVSGFVDAIASVVNYIARLYEDIKAEIVAFAGSAIDALGIVDCGPGSPCQAVLSTALTTALVAMGVPPSLPDFDALVNEGVDYVKGYVATQAGIPGPVADAAEFIVREMVEEAKENQGGNGLPEWLVYDNRFRPAVVVVDVLRNPLAALQASELRIQATPVPMFLEGRIPFPLTLNEARLPVVLPPNLDGLEDLCVTTLGTRVCFPPEVQQKHKLALWHDLRYADRCASLRLEQFIGGPIFGSVSPLAAHRVWTTDPATFGPVDSAVCQ